MLHAMFFFTIWYTLSILFVMECAILDPALYLQPSPPMKLLNSAFKWIQSPHSAVEMLSETVDVSNTNRETMARTFWPKIRTDYRLGSIHIPLTFSVSGLYGNRDAGSKSAVGTSYASVLGVRTSKIVTTNSYPSLTGLDSEPTIVRIYGSNNKPEWGGWGNGKWGHYGKG